MKRLIIPGLSSLIALLLINANAQDTSELLTAPYVGLHGGITFPTGMGGGKLNADPIVGAQAGYRMGNVRIEGALSYYNNSFKGSHSAQLRMATLMANFYYDFNLDFPFVLFIGVGVGWVHTWKTHVDVILNSPESNEFSYQGIAGVNFPISNRLIIGVGCRLLGWTDDNGNQNLIESNLNYLF